jgi:hypothetical protein
MKHTTVLLLLFSFLLSSVTQSQPTAADPHAKPAAQTQLTGTLERRIAIGGETTGWALRHGEKQSVELLLPVEAFAWIKEGLVVSVTGVYDTKHYPERGAVKVFVVKQISEVVR